MISESQTDSSDDSASPEDADHISKELSYKIKVVLLMWLKSKGKASEFDIQATGNHSFQIANDSGKFILHTKFTDDANSNNFSSFFEEIQRDLLKMFKTFLSEKKKGTDVGRLVLVTDCTVGSCIDESFRNCVSCSSNSEDDLFGEFERIKLSNNLYENDAIKMQMQNVLKAKFIATELMQFLGNNSGNYEIIRAYKNLINEAIYDESSHKFYCNFVDAINLNNDIQYIRDNLVLSNTQLQEASLDKLVTVFDNHNDSEMQELDKYSSIDMDNSIEEFIEKFLIVSLKTDSLNDNVSVLLANDWNLGNFKSLDFYLDSVINDKEHARTPIETIVRDLKTRFVIEKLTELKSLIFSRQLKFKNISLNLMEFLIDSTNSSHNICYVKTPPKETFFALCKIYQCVQSFSKQSEFLFLQTNLESNLFEESIEIFRNQESLKFCVIEVNQKYSNINDISEFSKIVTEDSTKKLIIVSDENVCSNEDVVIETRKIVEDSVTLSDLTETSLEELLNDSTVFQDNQINFFELIDSTSWCYLPLRDWEQNKVIAQNVVVSKLYDKNLYVPRNFKICNKIKRDILSAEFADDLFTFDEIEFEFLCRNFPCKNIHLFGKYKNEFLLWRKTKGSISSLMEFLDLNHFTEISEKDFLDMTGNCSKFIVIVDDAGTGKSCFSNHIAEKLKERFEDHWIINITLNRFTQYFSDNSFENKKSVTEFLAQEVLGLKTDFQVKLFRWSLKHRGNVFVVLDGFDEVAPFYEKNVFNMIEILGRMAIRRIFVSTRPILGGYLETKLNVLRHVFSEFSEENQVTYLAKYWMETGSDKDLKVLEEIGYEILNYVNHALPDVRLPTGVPLTLKLLAESFKNEIVDAGNFDTKQLSLNLFNLFDRFFDEKISIYFHEKHCWDENQEDAKAKMDQDRILIREICEKLAVTKIFSLADLCFVCDKQDLNLVESELQAIQKCGLVYEEANEYNFIHKSLAEHLTTNYLFRHSDHEDVLDLIFNFVLEDKRYGVVQSFMLDYIENEGLIAQTDFNRSAPKRMILLGLLNKLLVNTQFSHKQERILGKILCYYIAHFTDIEPILLKIHRIQLAKILRFQFELKTKFTTTNLLMSSLACEQNCVKLLDGCFHRFKDNLNLIEDLFSISDERGRNFLFVALDSITDCGRNRIDRVDLFFAILAKFKEIIDYSNSRTMSCQFEDNNYNVFEKLLLSKDPIGFSIFHLLIKKNVDSLRILDYLKWVSECFSHKKAEAILKSNNPKSFCCKILSVENKTLIQNYFEAASVWLQDSKNFLKSFDDFEEILKKAAFRELLNRRHCFENIAGDLNCSIELKTFDVEFVEYFGILYLNELLKNEIFANLLIKSYLVDDRFKSFRMIFDHFLTPGKIEINYKLFFKIISNYILEMNSYKCSFFVAFEENHFATFDVLLNAVIFSEFQDGVDTWGMLARKIGIEFMKIVLLHKREKFLLAKNVNLLFVSLFNERSLLKLLQFLKEAFSKSDPTFFEGILLSRDSDGRTFLHFIFYLCEKNQFDKNQILEYFFKVLRSLETVDLGILEKLFIAQDSEGKTLLHLMVDIGIESTEIIEYLKWSQKRFGLKFIQKYLIVKSRHGFIFCDNFYLNRDVTEFEQIQFSNLLEDILLKFAENDSIKEEYDALKKFARNKILLENHYPVVSHDVVDFQNQTLFDLGILKKYLNHLEFVDTAHLNYFAFKGFHGFLPKSYKQKNAGKFFSTVLGKREKYKEISWLIEMFFQWKLMEKDVTLHTYVIEAENLFYLLLDILIKILETKKLTDVAEKVLFAKNVVGYSFLHVIFEYDNRANRNFYSNLFDRLRKIKKFFSEETFQDLFMIRGHFGLTFVHLIRNLDAFDAAIDFLQTEFNETFVRDLLLLKCNTGNSLNWLKVDISLFIDLLKSLKKKFEMGFIKDFLKQKDNDGRNFLFEPTFANPFHVTELLQVFTMIYQIFGRDMDLFDDLFNSIGFWYNLDSENKLESTGIKKIVKEYEKKNQSEKSKLIFSWIRNNLGEDFLKKTLS